MNFVNKLVKAGKLKRKKIRLIDLDKQERAVTSKRTDNFSYLYLNEEDLKKCNHFKNTLLGYL
jgi:hypothetical protein